MASLDLTDELRVTAETPDTIKARLLADTNAGVDPADPAYADTHPGSFWDDFNGAISLEHDRVYDRMNETVAAAIPATSSGEFLDAWAASLGLERKQAAFAGGKAQFTGDAGAQVPAGTQVSTEKVSEDAEPQAFQTIVAAVVGVGGTVAVDVKAVAAGSEGSVPANSVVILDSTVSGVESVTNPGAMTGGADVETDDALRQRILRKLAGSAGGGNGDDYVNWGLAYPGVGHVTVQPNTPTLGRVGVVITDVGNDPMPQHAIDGLQALLDPSDSATQGSGLAPVGARVTVSTPTSKAIAVAAAITLEPGFSVDGAGGTKAVRPDVSDAVARYVNALPVGGDVIHSKVLAAIVNSLGVADIGSLALNGQAAGTSVAVGPSEVASLTLPLTLT